MLLRTLAAVPLLLLAHAALADSLDLNLRNDAVQFTYGHSYRSAEITGGALWKEEENDSGSRWAAHLGLLASGSGKPARRNGRPALAGACTSRRRAAARRWHSPWAASSAGRQETLPSASAPTAFSRPTS